MDGGRGGQRDAGHVDRSCTNRLEVLGAPVDLAHPVAPDLAAPPLLPRGRVFPFVAGVGGDVELGLLVPLRVDLEVRAEALLLRECLAVAGWMRASGRVHGAGVVLEGGPGGVVCWGSAVRRKTSLMRASIPFIWRR